MILSPAAPLVSIIIPCWNAVDTVGEAIASALAQSYPNIEVIVIDDGSTDASLDVVRSFGNRLRWETGPNRGACAARNRGIGLAAGELIQFLDADDLLYSEKLSQMVPVALEQGDGSMVLCAWEQDGGEGMVAQQWPVRHPGEDEVVWCTHNSLQTASPLHWKGALEEIGGFDERLPCAQERDLHLRLACYGRRFVPLPKVLVRVRRREGSLSSDWHRVIGQHLRIVQRAHGLLAERGRLNDAHASALAGLLARDARVLLGAGLRAEALRYFQEARRLHPGAGLNGAYSPRQRAAVKLLGPESFEQLVRLKRALLSA